MKLSNIFSGIAEGLRAARYSQALNQMNDRQLADIGMSRADIPRRALEMARNR